MKVCLPFFTIVLLFSSCNFSGWKKLDLNAFEISVPDNWKFKPIRGIDSFAGEIVSDNVDLLFDYSQQGLAGNLVPTEAEYLNLVWMVMYSKPEDARETMSLPEGQKIIDFAMEKRRATEKRSANRRLADTTVIFIRRIKKKAKQIQQPDYWAIVKFNRKTDTIPLNVPVEIKQENFSIDTTGKYVTKTMWPKVTGKGISGISIRRTDSDFTFILKGQNLSAKNQQLALQAFKTIKFKDK